MDRAAGVAAGIAARAGGDDLQMDHRRGDALDGASWETAETLLEAAVQGDPCVPDHHFELARVYAHTGDVDGAERALASVRELTADATGAEARLRDKAAQFEKEWRDNGRKI